MEIEKDIKDFTRKLSLSELFSEEGIHLPLR